MLTGLGTVNMGLDASGGGIVQIAPSGAGISMGGQVTAASLATSGTIAGSLCRTSGGLILYESGASNCTISLESLKKNISVLDKVTAFHDVMNLNPIAYEFKDPTIPGKRYGLGANQVHSVNSTLSTYDGNGRLQAFDPNAILAELVVVVQQQQREIDSLKSQIRQSRRMH
jgi:hypothetical protein